MSDEYAVSDGSGCEEYNVGRTARRAGVTVRTLHHYDDIGLVRPSVRSPAGYRVYGPADIERLRQVLVYRRLGFGLAEIAALVSDPTVDAVAHLRRQRELLVERAHRLTAMVAAIDRELEARTMGMHLTPAEQLEIFGTDQVGGEWADEAAERWGDTEPYQQSQRRVAAYGPREWAQIRAEADDGLRASADLMRAGRPASGPEAMDLAEQHRQYLGRWFYDCGYDQHRGLARTYIEDERFTRTYDAGAVGRARFVHDAITANADAHS